MHRSIALIAILLSAIAASAATPAPLASFSVQPHLLVNGSACLLTAQFKSSPERVSGRLLGHDIVFSPGLGGMWYALAGVAYETKPGTYDLALEVTARDGSTVHVVEPVTVHAAHYKTSRLTVPQKYVTPDPETLKRIEAEREIKKAIYAHSGSSPEWSGNFVAPVAMEISEDFGTSRTFNGKLASVHKGTDFRAPMGTPVHASNGGQVVLARELYYEGNCVIIDHGLGFFTLYMHLSQFDVKEGDSVEKGQTIGLSGSTGRVTGPHLHMSVRWSGIDLDPTRLLALTLPQSP